MKFLFAIVLLALASFVLCDAVCLKNKDEASCAAGSENDQTCMWCQTDSVSICASAAQSELLPEAFECAIPAVEMNTQSKCTITLGIQCAAVIAGCVGDCKDFGTACLQCIGNSMGSCCPCLKDAFGEKFPC